MKLNIDDSTLNSLNENKKIDCLRGLAKGELGFILAAPDRGKGFLCLSIAYEASLGQPIVDVSNSDVGMQSVLYWPAEDGAEQVANRIAKHKVQFAPTIWEHVVKNLFLWNNQNPIFDPTHPKFITDSYTELLEAAKDVDILIIDTLREAAGLADEVKDDLLVKKYLQKLAKEADVALVLVHHITKNAARGLEAISSVSGSGFSRTQANSRLHLFLDVGSTDAKKTAGNQSLKKQGSQNNSQTVTLTHLKANNVNLEKRLRSSPLVWTEHSVLTLKNTITGKPLVSDLLDVYKQEWLAQLNSPEIEYEESAPSTSNMDEIVMKVSSEAMELAKKHVDSQRLSKQDKQAYALFLAEQQRARMRSENNSKD